MRQVLYPKYLLGGLMQRGGGIGGAERTEGDSLAGGLRGMIGRWPDADVVLQSGMSEGLRDWDLWYVDRGAVGRGCMTDNTQGSITVLPAAQLLAV